MDSSTRAELVRAGNRAFNEGDYAKARELFTNADYKDGLIRIGDYYMYDRRLPLLAFGYYKRAGAKDKVADLHRRMIGAIGQLIGQDKLKEDSLKELGLKTSNLKAAPVNMKPDADGMISVPVSPILRDAALKILAGKK